MITDSNSTVEFAYQTLVGATSGDFLFLAMLVLLIVALALIVGRVKAGTALMIGMFVTFVFALIVPALMVLFWVIIIISLLIFVNGLRKTWVGY